MGDADPCLALLYLVSGTSFHKSIMQCEYCAFAGWLQIIKLIDDQ